MCFVDESPASNQLLTRTPPPHALQKTVLARACFALVSPLLGMVVRFRPAAVLSFRRLAAKGMNKKEELCSTDLEGFRVK